MQRLDGTLVLSATDLVGYLACDHLATLELGRVAGLWERPHRRDDPTIEIIQEKGDLHEQSYLDALRNDGLSVVEISKTDLRSVDDLQRAAQDTTEAMRRGADVIYQATFFDGRWRGHADFLFRRDDRSSPAFGDHSYDIADTKLARAVKAGAVLQMCVYAALLEAVQGIAPEWLTVVTGDRASHRHRTEDFSAYFRYVRDRFEAKIERDRDDPQRATTYPNPVEHCRVCPWSPTCIQRRRDDDHLSIVAGMRRVDTERLTAGGLPQLAVLARTAQAATVAEMPPTTFERLRNQARLQLHERETGERIFELLEPSADLDTRGLGILPEPSKWDVFFDIEADPWAGDDGLEYLLGIVTVDSGEPVYRPIWGTSPDGERAALSELLRFLMTRLEAHPELHVFHYGGYEGRRAQAARRPPRLRRRGAGPPAAGRHPGRPPQRRAPGHPGLGRVVLAQADREVLHAGSRRPGHGCRASASWSSNAGCGNATRASSTASRPTTATTVSPPGCFATGWRRGASRRWRRWPDRDWSRPDPESRAPVRGPDRLDQEGCPPRHVPHGGA